MRRLQEFERGVVIRLGRIHRIVGAGLVFLLPFVDTLAVVNLDETILDWKSAMPEELNQVVEFLVGRYPEIPRQLSLQEVRERMRTAR